METRDIIWLSVTLVLFALCVMKFEAQDTEITMREQEIAVLEKRLTKSERKAAIQQFTIDSLRIQKNLEEQWARKPMYETEPLLPGGQ